MNLVKKCVASLLLTFVYAWSVVFAFSTVNVFPGELVVHPGDSIEFIVEIPEKSTKEVAFQWYIDGKEIDGMMTSALSLTWSDYLSYFPEDAIDDSTRSISVTLIDESGLQDEDTAKLYVVHHEAAKLPEPIQMSWDIEPSCAQVIL